MGTRRACGGSWHPDLFFTIFQTTGIKLPVPPGWECLAVGADEAGVDVASDEAFGFEEFAELGAGASEDAFEGGLDDRAHLCLLL